MPKGKNSAKSVQISSELFDLLIKHFHINDLPDTDPTEETTAEYYKREDRIKLLLTEKYNKTLLRNAYKKITEAKTVEEKSRAEEFYKMVKKTLLK